MNADVLEVIAEYACATVTDVGALRAVNKGYRRAVDTPDAPFARLARACPRLMSVSARWDGPGAPPPGWVGAAGEMLQPPWNRYHQRVSL